MRVHKSPNDTAPTYIADVLQQVAQLQRHSTLRSATNNDLVVPRCRLRSVERALTVVAPRLLEQSSG